MNIFVESSFIEIGVKHNVFLVLRKKAKTFFELITENYQSFTGKSIRLSEATKDRFIRIKIPGL